MSAFYSEYYNVKVTIARPFNLYGRNQKDIFLIPHIIKQVMNSNYIEVEVLHLNPKRDYLYINNLINGNITFMNIDKGSPAADTNFIGTV